MNHEDFPIVAVFLGVALLVGLVVTWQFRRSEQILNNWAVENGFLIVRCERRLLRRGPFLWTSSKGQDIYYITVQDRNGWNRNAYVRRGSFLAGILSNTVEVRWDEPSPHG